MGIFVFAWSDQDCCRIATSAGNRVKTQPARQPHTRQAIVRIFDLVKFRLGIGARVRSRIQTQSDFHEFVRVNAGLGMTRTIWAMKPAAAAQASDISHPRDRRARLLPSRPLSGGILRGLALAAGVSITTALIFNPAIAQQSLDGGTAVGANAERLRQWCGRLG